MFIFRWLWKAFKVVCFLIGVLLIGLMLYTYPNDSTCVDLVDTDTELHTVCEGDEVRVEIIVIEY